VEKGQNITVSYELLLCLLVGLYFEMDCRTSDRFRVNIQLGQVNNPMQQIFEEYFLE